MSQKLMRLVRLYGKAAITFLIPVIVLNPTLSCLFSDANCEGGITDECNKYEVDILFQNERDNSPRLSKVITGWLHEVYNLVAKDVTVTYSSDESVNSVGESVNSGDEYVKTDQIMTFTGVKKELTPIEEYEVCLDVSVGLGANLTANNFTLLNVACNEFNYTDSSASRMLRRRLQEEEVNLVMDFKIEVTAEYTHASRFEKEVGKDDELAEIVEDSINADDGVGKEVTKTLIEREILVEGAQVSSKIATPSPTPPPTPPPQAVVLVPAGDGVARASADEPQGFMSSPTGIAVIVTCALVVFLIAGFMFYKGMQSSKVDQADIFWDNASDFSSYVSNPYDSKTKGRDVKKANLYNTDSGSSQDGHSDDGRKEAMPSHYTGNETNLFGRQVGSRRTSFMNQNSALDKQNRHMTTDENEDWVDEKIRRHENISASKQNRRLDHDNSQQRLDAFEARVRQKSNEPDHMDSRESRESLRKLNDFDAKLQRKLDSTPKMQRDESLAQLDSFEEKVRKKSQEEDSKARGRSSAPDSGFDERLLRKASGRLPPTKGNSQANFEDRLRDKLESSRDLKSTPPSSRRLDEFEAKIQAKSKEGEKVKSQGSSPGAFKATSTSYEERLKSKISNGDRNRDRGFSEDSNASGSSFEQRLEKKLSGREISSTSSRRLDDLEARIKAKSREGDKKKSSESSWGAASGKSYEDRLQSKLSVEEVERYNGSSQDSVSSGLSFEDRLKDKLSRNVVSTPQGREPTPSSLRLDEFEAKVQAKIKEGDKVKSRGSSPGAFKATSTSYEERLKSKISNGDRNRDRGFSEDSNASGSSFEQRLEKKLSGREISSTSSRRLDDLEARIKAKSREGDKNQRGISPGAQSSSSGGLDDFEKRIAAKNAQGNKLPSPGTSPGSQSSSSRGLDDFEKRIAAKSKQGNTDSSRGSLSGSQSSPSRRLDDLEARIQAKNRAGDKKQRGISPGTRSTSASSSRSLDDFEKRIAAKTAGEKNMSRGSSLGSAPAETYEEKLEKKLAEGGMRNSSAIGVDRSSMSSLSASQQLDRFNTRVASAKTDNRDSKSSSDRFQAAFSKARAINT